MKTLLTLATLLTTSLTLSAQPEALNSINQKLMLGGELSNSAATSAEDIREVMPRMSRIGLNTVLAPVYWEFLEPTEGRYDFSLVDELIANARKENMQIVILWFGAWKNSMSCYAPEWFKRDVKRFPRAYTSEGKPLEIASAFSDKVLQADGKAFEALMAHVAKVDPERKTVVMTQVENEIGMLESARDHSPLANKAYAQPVPAALKKYLSKNTLHPSLKQRYNAKGNTWAECFGSDAYGDEVFMAWHYALYVEQLSQIARRHTSMPLYVNTALNSRGRKPGEYPSAGPLAHLIDIWRAAAPTLSMLSPDIYDTGFKQWAANYALPGNMLFIPETRCSENAAVRALYTFGEYGALGFSPFAIDQTDERTLSAISSSYSLLKQLEPLIISRRGTADSRGLLFDSEEKESILEFPGVTLTCRHNFTLPWDPRATNGTTWPEGGGIVLRLAKDEFIVAGNGIVVQFATPSEKRQEIARQLGEDGFAEAGKNAASATTRFEGKRIGLASVDQVSINPDGTFRFIRRDNGDQSHQGRHARISVGDWKILRVKLYEY